MREDLLAQARRQAEQAGSPIHAAALLWMARAGSLKNAARARQTFLEGVDAVQKLPDAESACLLDEAHCIAAALAPDLLPALPVTRQRSFGARPRAHLAEEIVEIMLAHDHGDAAFDYLMRCDDSTAFPYLSVGGVVHRLHARDPESADRRQKLLRHAFEVWRKAPYDPRDHESQHFVRLLGNSWRELPADESLSMARTVVERAANEPDAGGSFGYPEIHFSSRRQDALFRVFHVLRHLDPALAESLTAAHQPLAKAIQRYPHGMETMHAESEARAESQRAAGMACEGDACGNSGFSLPGDEEDPERQRRVIEAARAGDFAPSLEDARRRYRQDTLPDGPNLAPKAFWPSTGAFRSVLHQAGHRLGDEAAILLQQIPDDDLRLFAAIELAAALDGVSAPRIRFMQQQRPPDWGTGGRTAGRDFSAGFRRLAPGGPPMRSRDGRRIRCPKCLVSPRANTRWTCKCGHRWNTFTTAGKCPACRFQWEVTACPNCGETSEHRAWYQSEP